MSAKIPRTFLLTFLAGCCWLAAAPAEKSSTPGDTVAFTDSLRAALDSRATAIFKKSCAGAGCHSGAYPKARLSLEPSKIRAIVDAPSRQVDTLRIIDTKRPERSYLLMKIHGDKGIKGERMPDERPPLSAEDVKTITLWTAGLALVEPIPADDGKKKP